MIKMSFAFCVFSLVALAAAPTTQAPTPEPPNGIPQCARFECPVYSLLEDYGAGISKRLIEPGLWYSKVAPSCNISAAESTALYRSLNSSFTGNNLPRTTPIIFEISINKARSSFCPDQSDYFPCCAEKYAMHFYVPPERRPQATPPPPTEEGVLFLNASQPREFFVMPFTSEATMENVRQLAEQLTAYLTSEDLPFENDSFSVAAYYLPWEPLPHFNELLIPVKNRNKKRGRPVVGGSDQNNGRGNHGHGENRGRDGNGEGPGGWEYGNGQ